MISWNMLTKAFHSVLVVSYFSLLLSNIACFFHCESQKQDSAAHVHHAQADEGHHQGHNGHQQEPAQDSSGHAMDIFCKHVQNISGVAVISSPLASPFTQVLTYETKPEPAVVINAVEKIYLTRAPPVNFS